MLQRKAFFMPSFEIYGSVAGFYDYGPNGCKVKQNVTQFWRQHFVLHENMQEVGSPACTQSCLTTVAWALSDCASSKSTRSVQYNCHSAAVLLAQGWMSLDTAQFCMKDLAVVRQVLLFRTLTELGPGSPVCIKDATSSLGDLSGCLVPQDCPQRHAEHQLMGQSLTLSMSTQYICSCHSAELRGQVHTTAGFNQPEGCAGHCLGLPRAVLCSLATIYRKKPMSAHAAGAQPCCKPQSKSLHAAKTNPQHTRQHTSPASLRPLFDTSHVQVECPAVTPEVVLRASGHVERFTDLMVTDKVTGDCHRADHLLEHALEALLEDTAKPLPADRRKVGCGCGVSGVNNELACWRTLPSRYLLTGARWAAALGGLSVKGTAYRVGWCPSPPSTHSAGKRQGGSVRG